MTYCVGIMPDNGLIFASDPRTHAGVGNFASFCKMTVLNSVGYRVIVLLSSGNLAGTQAIISILKQQNAADGVTNLCVHVQCRDAGIRRKA
jgi:putative proteasome-type protease